MKKLFLLLIALLLMATTYSQDCSPSTSQIDLNINNVIVEDTMPKELGIGDFWEIINREVSIILGIS